MGNNEFASEELYNRVRAAAKSVAFRWPGVANADDLEQEMWLRLLETSSYFARLKAMSGSEQDRALKGIGHQLASQEREDYAHFTGNFHYSTRDVRRLLADWAEGLTGDADPGGMSHSEQADLSEGLAQLADRQPGRYAVVVAEFVKREPVHSSAVELMRSVDSLTQHMNAHRRNAEADHEGIGNRRVTSNHRSITQTPMEVEGFTPKGRM